ERSGIEDVRVFSTQNVLADDGDSRGDGENVPRLHGRHDHGDDQAGKNRATGILPFTFGETENRQVDEGRGEDGAEQARRNERDAFLGRSENDENYKDDGEETLGCAEELPDGLKRHGRFQSPGWCSARVTARTSARPGRGVRRDGFLRRGREQRRRWRRR